MKGVYSCQSPSLSIPIKFESGFIEFKDIPINQYQKTIEEEKANYSKEEFMRIFRDMTIIREFETMINEIKTTGEYNGYPITIRTCASVHRSEASAVGQAYLLMKMILFSAPIEVMERFSKACRLLMG